MQKIAIAALVLAMATACGEIGPPRTAGGTAPQSAGAAPVPAQGAAPAPVQGAAASAPRDAAASSLAANSQIAPVPPGPVPAQPVPSGLSVVGEATVKAEPDVAYVTTGVQTRGQTARQAQDENTRKMNDILAAIKRLGVADADIRTSGINLHPNYGRQPDQIEGYIATNSVTITVQDVRRVGEVLDATVTAGANQAGGIQFSIKDDTQLRRQALDQAVKAARVRADAIAGAAGLRVTTIQSLTDVSSGAAAPPMPMPRVAQSMAADAASGPVPVQPGQLAVTARVQVVYSLQ
jgi:uncharacterized protein YggE